MLRDRFLATPWPLTLIVALAVALPILVQGELSAADTRARVRDEQVAATARLAAQAAASLNSAIRQIRDEVAAVAIRPASGRPTQLIDALQRGDSASVQEQLRTLQSLISSISTTPIPPLADTVFINDARTILFSSSPTIAAGRETGGVGGPVDAAAPWGAATPSKPVAISPVFFSSVGAANLALRAPPGVASAPEPIRVRVEAYIDRALGDAPVRLAVGFLVSRVASETLLPLFRSVDELYVIDEQGRLILRASHAFTPDTVLLRDLSSDAVVAAVRGSQTVSLEGDDPFGRGRRLIASAVLPDVDWRVIAEQSTSAIGEQLDASLLQQRAVRGLLAALLVAATYLFARSASQVARQRRELAETNRRLVRASEAKSAFLASVSHELRTPMNAIIGFTEALLAGVDGPLNDEQRSSLGWVQRGGQDLLGLINEILDLSKIEAGKLVLSPEPFDPRELLETVVAQFRSLAAGKGVKLSWRDDGMPEEVVLDRGRTRQVVINLVGNALKFTDKGEVEVAGAGAADGRLRLAVRDTGTGIAAGQLEAIFEEFRQIEGTVGGTGLGLPISRRLARLMGGDVTVRSATGIGSTFTVDLPRDLRRASVREAEVAPASGTERLLLAVDDDPSVGPLLEKMLGDRKYRVAMPTPSSAVAEARRLHPSVITLDVLMPERSGHDILRELRSDPATRDIPVITLSVVDPADAPKDADKHLTKPLRKDRLLRVLDEIDRERAAVGKR